MHFYKVDHQLRQTQLTGVNTFVPSQSIEPRLTASQWDQRQQELTTFTQAGGDGGAALLEQSIFKYVRDMQ